jgi:hypothetical protein
MCSLNASFVIYYGARRDMISSRLVRMCGSTFPRILLLWNRWVPCPLRRSYRYLYSPQVLIDVIVTQDLYLRYSPLFIFQPSSLCAVWLLKPTSLHVTVIFVVPGTDPYCSVSLRCVCGKDRTSLWNRRCPYWMLCTLKLITYFPPFFHDHGHGPTYEP